MRRHFLAIALILTVASGCDNVAWGGLEVRVDAPPPTDPVAANNGEVPAPVEAPPPPRGPLVLAGTRTGVTVTLSPVGMLLPEGLRPVPPELLSSDDPADGPLALGSEWILFADGTRVGRVTLTRTGSDPALCGPSITVSGTVEMRPGAATAERFLALPSRIGEEQAYEPYEPLEHTYDQRVGLLRMAGEAVPDLGARWPPEGMLSVRRDMQAFQPEGAAAPSSAATFVHLDGIDSSAAPEGSYALFMIAEQVDGQLVERFRWYRPADDAAGKAVPRLFSHLDWDRDGTGEVLLEVFGEGRRWYAALDREPAGPWRESFASGCSAATDR